MKTDAEADSLFFSILKKVKIAFKNIFFLFSLLLITHFFILAKKRVGEPTTILHFLLR